MFYYEAELVMLTSNKEDSKFEDLGVIDTITASSLDNLMDKLNRSYDLQSFKMFSNGLESGWMQGFDDTKEHFTIYINKVVKTEVNELELARVLKGR